MISYNFENTVQTSPILFICLICSEYNVMIEHVRCTTSGYDVARASDPPIGARTQIAHIDTVCVHLLGELAAVQWRLRQSDGGLKNKEDDT